jgi:hypothetical protein
MSSKKPWTVEGVPWKSEAAFWSWVRGVLRKGWSKHPVKIEYIKKYRKRIKNPKPSNRFPDVWGMQCEVCKKDTVQTEIEIDHISETGGKFTCLDDTKDYMEHLFLVDFSCLRAVCKPCHSVISYSQKQGISFEAAQLEKKIIEFCKQDKQIILDFLAERQYNGSSVSSEAKRRKLIETIFREKMNEQTMDS